MPNALKQLFKIAALVSTSILAFQTAQACTPKTHYYRVKVSPEGVSPAVYETHTSFIYSNFWGQGYKKYAPKDTCIAIIRVDAIQSNLPLLDINEKKQKRLEVSVLEALTPACPTRIKAPLWSNIDTRALALSGCNTFYEENSVWRSFLRDSPNTASAKMTEWRLGRENFKINIFMKEFSGQKCILFSPLDSNKRPEISCGLSTTANKVPTNELEGKLPLTEPQATELLIEYIRQDVRATENHTE